MNSFNEVANALRLLETLRYNEVHVKQLRFLGLSDDDIANALRLLKKQNYEIQNESGLLRLKNVPLFNLSAIKCAYMKNHELSEFVIADNYDLLCKYLHNYEEPHFIYSYRKWHGLSNKEMRELIRKEMFKNGMELSRNNVHNLKLGR